MMQAKLEQYVPGSTASYTKADLKRDLGHQHDAG